MPKEIITNGAYRRGNPWIQVGWSRGTYVQVGVLTESRQATPVPVEEGSPLKVGGMIHDANQENLRRPEELTAEGEALFCDLDRDGINRMIRALRKARDAAFGSDA